MTSCVCVKASSGTSDCLLPMKSRRWHLSMKHTDKGTSAACSDDEIPRVMEWLEAKVGCSPIERLVDRCSSDSNHAARMAGDARAASHLQARVRLAQRHPLVLRSFRIDRGNVQFCELRSANHVPSLS